MAGKVARLLGLVEQSLLAGGILVIALLTIANVFCRTFLGFSVAFAEEVSQFLIVMVTFVGLSYGASQGRHIRMTALYDELPDGPKRVLTIFICFSTSALLFFLAGYAVSYCFTVGTLGTVSPVLQIPLAWVYLSAPLGLTLAALQYLLSGIKNCTSKETYLSYTVPVNREQAIGEGI